MAERRTAIMDAWRRTVTADPQLTTGTSLPRAQLHDHIPALLEDYERRLTAGGLAERTGAEDDQKGDAAAHGLHRWQQGFDLGEVTRELGRLNECVVLELEDYAVQHPSMDQGAMAEARRIWAALYSVAISASTSQYFKLQQLEASSHVSDLEHALESLRELESRRAELWQQAAHDLRGNLGVVVTATAGLTSVKASPDARGTFLGLLERNVRALHRLLEDVTSLARLQGGQEHRTLTAMDATPLLREVCESMQPLAQEKALFLRFDGPPDCMVESDAVKIRRIVQNLVLNAVKYTDRGGVAVTWGQNASNDSDRWFIQVRDTGPGFHAGPGSEIVGALEVATDQAKDVAVDAVSGDVTHVSNDPPGPHPADRDTRPLRQQPGEGIGLSIVKRLCELLDATMELNSKIDQGTTVRILLPRRYGGS
jgi:signal transduction histidine kinase